MTAPSIKPRPAPAASVPGLLGLLQAEWDAVALEAHTLRTSLHATRVELAHALYQHDAAVRVIARLTRERDAARAAAAAGGSAAAAAAGAGAADAAPAPKRAKAGGGAAAPAPPAAVVASMTALSQDLAKGRKKRDAHPPGTAGVEEAARFALQGAPHTVSGGGHGGAIACLAAAPASAGASALAVSEDGGVAVLDTATGAVARLEGGGGGGGGAPPPARAAAWLGADGASALTAGADGRVRLWTQSSSGGAWTLASTAAAGEDGGGAALVAVTTHPSRALAAAAGCDGAWSLFDVSSSSTPSRLLRIADAAAAAAGGYTACAFHPDGVILGAGTGGGAVQVWDARAAGAPVATCAAPPPVPAAKAGGPRASSAPAPPIASLSFSENGYYLATGALGGGGASGGVRLWDLRKLKHFASPPAPPGKEAGAGGAACVAWDASGALLAAAGPGGASILGGGSTKAEWGAVAAWAGGSVGGGGTAVAWGAPPAAGRLLYVGGGDGRVRVFGVDEMAA